MTETVAVRGTVATSPRHVVPDAGAPITSFRLVADDRRPRRRAESGRAAANEAASDSGAQCNWFTVTAFDDLAVHAAACFARGDPLVVTGRLCVRDWEGEQLGVTVEIEAQAIGHDLAWGRSEFTRSVVGVALPDPLSAVPDVPRSQGQPTAAGP
jgi:single-strand DNA-binding protein